MLYVIAVAVTLATQPTLEIPSDILQYLDSGRVEWRTRFAILEADQKKRLTDAESAKQDAIRMSRGTINNKVPSGWNEKQKRYIFPSADARKAAIATIEARIETDRQAAIDIGKEIDRVASQDIIFPKLWGKDLARKPIGFLNRVRVFQIIDDRQSIVDGPGATYWLIHDTSKMVLDKEFTLNRCFKYTRDETYRNVRGGMVTSPVIESIDVDKYVPAWREFRKDKSVITP